MHPLSPPVPALRRLLCSWCVVAAATASAATDRAATVNKAVAGPTPVPPDAAAQALQAAVRAAAAGGRPSVAVAPGDYFFRENDFEVFDAVGLAVGTGADPAGPGGSPAATLWFSGGAGVHVRNSTSVSLSGFVIDYDPPPPAASPAGITLLLNDCDSVNVTDVTIRAAPYMAVTAFNGEGGHVFRRVVFTPSPKAAVPWRVASRDAMHFSDLRRGPTVVDSVVGHSGDDFFNIHNTLLLLVECADGARSCVVANPHVASGGPNTARPLYGGNSVMSTVRAGDHFAFYSWPSNNVVSPRLGGAAVGASEVTGRTRVGGADIDGGRGNGKKNGSRSAFAATVATTSPLPNPDAALEAKISALKARLIGKGSWVALTNQTMPFNTELWRVDFAEPLPASVAAQLGAGNGVLVNIEEIGCDDAVLENNTFAVTMCNLGRLKSSNARIVGNAFSNATIPNLEISYLPQWFEGPVEITGVAVANNTFANVGPDPVHCGPLCEAPCTRGGKATSCDRVTNTAPCEGCPNCSLATPWASLSDYANNTAGPWP